MKTKLITTMLCLLITSILCGQTKAEERIIKEQSSEKQYLKIKEMVNSGAYRVDVKFVHPMGGSSINRYGDGYYLKISSKTVECNLPYFGVVHTSGYGNGRSIVLDATYENYEVNCKDKKQKIVIKFKANNELENYDIILTVFKNGNSSFSVQSINRNTISYSGKISSIS
ncbi:DUF4251 domain-containing protein [uncultured Maribacter sp.]|uniref:DUF4251 domain-containing protein n=1 Tax=uncultured Maribacter sp. TaxID=431308 RepID=UPI002621D47A|nr:DUF4251 domain-containing protein [uncultured Maribacter sp.]